MAPQHFIHVHGSTAQRRLDILCRQPIKRLAKVQGKLASEKSRSKVTPVAIKHSKQCPRIFLVDGDKDLILICQTPACHVVMAASPHKTRLFDRLSRGMFLFTPVENVEDPGLTMSTEHASSNPRAQRRVRHTPCRRCHRRAGNRAHSRVLFMLMRLVSLKIF